MDVTQEKNKVFGEIAALRVSAEGYPKTILTNALASISQKTNSLDFLTDLLKALTGFESLRDTLVETLTYNLDEIELDIKQALKSALKSLVSCSINPSIPDEFINDGIRLELSKIDFLDIFKVRPTSEAGKLLYDDVYTGSESTDFNTFLYDTIQADGTSGYWGHVTFNQDILDIKFESFSSSATIPNNTILVKPSLYYSNSANNKKLTDLNNDYIDSITLFNSSKLINNIIDYIFGSISVNVKKSKKTLERETKIQDIIDRIINADEEVIIDNSYFSFTNEEILDIEIRSKARKEGIKTIKTSTTIDTSIDIRELTRFNIEYENLLNSSITSQYIEEKAILIRKGLESLADASTENVDAADKLNVKISFIEAMLKQLMTAIFNVILTPKLLLILAVNHSIIYGESFTDVEDFMKKNKVLINGVLKTVRDAVVSVLLAKALKEIKILVADNIIKTQIERVKNKKAQIASLVGTPTNVLRQISGLTKF